MQREPLQMISHGFEQLISNVPDAQPACAIRNIRFPNITQLDPPSICLCVVQSPVFICVGEVSVSLFKVKLSPISRTALVEINHSLDEITFYVAKVSLLHF
jgi:hypothetical protein